MVGLYWLCAGEGRCIEFPVPEDMETSSVMLTVAASSLTSSVDYRFMDSVDVEIMQKGLLTFIQTDKPQYKPGQTGD